MTPHEMTDAIKRLAHEHVEDVQRQFVRAKRPLDDTVRFAIRLAFISGASAQKTLIEVAINDIRAKGRLPR